MLTHVLPDLILLDVMMPGLDGFETCRRLKASEQWRQIPIIFLTAKTETTDIVQVCEVISKFYKNESCGKCVPCRIGTDWINKVINRILHGQGRPEDIDLLRGVCINLGGEKMMDSRSFCPLGDAAAWPIMWGGLKYFEDEFQYWIRNKRSPVGREVGSPALWEETTEEELVAV